jgi:hypothetical protein
MHCLVNGITGKDSMAHFVYSAIAMDHIACIFNIWFKVKGGAKFKGKDKSKAKK